MMSKDLTTVPNSIIIIQLKAKATTRYVYVVCIYGAIGLQIFLYKILYLAFLPLYLDIFS
jgi:hypothetical protein